MNWLFVKYRLSMKIQHDSSARNGFAHGEEVGGKKEQLAVLRQNTDRDNIN